MADFYDLKAAAANENLIIHRGMVIFASILAGAGFAFGILQQFSLSGTDTQGIVGLLSMGVLSSYERLNAILVLLGGIVGAVLGQWLWMVLAQVQRILGHLPISVTLKRGAVPFAVFLSQMTYLYQGQAVLLFPLIAFAGLAAGFVLLAWLEQRDKRRIFFANPTESNYHPIAVFTHGGVLVLGFGVGWFIQSLPGVITTTGPLSWGLWFVLGVGIMVWILSLLIGALLNILYSKQTFDQVYLALALALLPLAILPIQATGVLQYFLQDKVIYARQVTWLPMVLAGIAGVAGLAFFGINLMKLKRQPIEVDPAAEELFKGLMLIVAIPFLVYAVAFWPGQAAYNPQTLVGQLDLFQEGESLSAVQAMHMGRLPFKEILLRHGFLADVTSSLTALSWFGTSVESYRMLIAIVAPLGVVAIYLLAIFCLPWLWAVLMALTILTGHIGTVPETRFFFPMISFIFTLYFIQRTQWIILIFSGLLTALSLIASFTAGVMALTGHLVLLLAYVFLGSNDWKNRLLYLGVYLGAALLGLLPWWLYLGMTGSLEAYFANFSWVLSNYTSVFGLPLHGLGATPNIGQILQFALPPVAITLGSLAVLQALRNIRQTGFLPWNVLLLVTLTGVYWMRYLSRSSHGFLQDVLPMAAMLLAFFIYRMTAKQRILRGIILAAFLPVLFIPQPGKHTLPELAGSFGMKNKIQVQGLTAGKTERLTNVFLPVDQAKILDAMAEYLEEQVGSAETFYDFSNQPLLYFLVPRRPVVKSLSTSGLATFAQQLEAIHDLDNAEVKTVLFQGKTGTDMMLDGIPSVVRQYALSEYLLQTYVPVKQIGSWVIFVPRLKGVEADLEAVAALQMPIQLYQLPRKWGTLGKYDPGQGSTVAGFLPLEGVKAVETKGVTVTAQGHAIVVSAFSKPVSIKLQRSSETKKSGNALVLQIKAAPSLQGKTVVLSWGEARQPIRFQLQGDNQSHRYVFRVGALPSWVYQKDGKTIRMEFPGGDWTWESAVLLQVADIPELARMTSAKPKKIEKK
ncbi:hypothetical protein KAR34_06740 [bacterium]|nr:hypothetical protein [bacterium]